MSLKFPRKLARPNFYNDYNSTTTSSSLLMGPSFSQSKDRNYTLHSDYGRVLEKGPIMGSGASSRHSDSPVHYRNRGASLSEGALNYGSRHTNHRYNTIGRSSPQISRPLPHGPGPLLPNNNVLKVNKRRPEAIVTKVKGPVKASHDLKQRGISSPEVTRNIPKTLQALGRQKSRSLNDIRILDNKEDQKPSADKMLTEADLKKARKTFKISRSPSCDNVNDPRQTPDHRALLDKMSKISTDSGQKVVKKNGKMLNSTGLQKPKTGVPKFNTQTRNKIDSHPDVSSKKEQETINKRNKDGANLERVNSLSCKESTLLTSRKLSDSAYESNSTTSSSSSNSSPKIVRKMSSSIQSNELPSGCHGSGLVGLRNLGNTCFMNSIIQCLRNTKKLREIFCSNYFIEDLNETTAPMKGRLATAFSSVVKEMWMTNKGVLVISPSTLKSQVQRYAPRFTGYSQQDSQEFLRFLLEGLHDDLNLVREKVKVAYGCDTKLCDTEQARHAWNWYAKREKSVISDLFVGQLKSTLTCAECHHRSLTFDPFWDLSLPIPSRSRTSLISGKVSINDCFKKFTQEEVLDGDEKPTCEMCKKRQKCFKRFSIERFPQILVIHLKRFSGLRYRTKLETLVDFPLELNLSSYAANSSIKKSEALYRLYGVSNHSGGTYSGHYTAYCRHPDTNDWYYYSDSSVMKLSSGRIVTEEAYVLFYELSNQMSYL